MAVGWAVSRVVVLGKRVLRRWEEDCEQELPLQQSDQVRNSGQAAKGDYFYFSF